MPTQTKPKDERKMKQPVVLRCEACDSLTTFHTQKELKTWIAEHVKTVHPEARVKIVDDPLFSKAALKKAK